MNRKEMEAVIVSGGSVLHEGRLITSLENLPSKAQLASTKEDKAAAAEDLDAQIARLQAERDALKAAPPEKSNTVFPADYPGFEVLGQIEGLDRAKFEAMSDKAILAINGIGPETLEAIRAYKD